MLERDPRIHLYYTNNVEELHKADIIVVPGTKSTLDDLAELRRNGAAQAIVRAHREGATVVGICGGYQILGREVCDPDGVEGSIERLPGLGLLPVSTVMTGEKITCQTTFRLVGDETPCHGYEIHMGRTERLDGALPLARTEAGKDEGCVAERTMGTYLHGILDNSAFIERLLAPFAEKLDARPFDYKAFKEEQYDRLADHVRRHVEMEAVYKLLQR